MIVREWITVLSSQRGVAFPMAMLALLILSALIIGFSALAATEPTIANNHLMVAQARAVAEAGIERAVWGLRNAGQPNGIPASGAIPAPYDGSQIIVVATGGTNIGSFRVRVATKTTVPYPPECPPAASMSRADRCIVSVGWAPSNTAARKAQQKITLVVTNPRFLFPDPPAALSVRGDLETGGNTLIDSRNSTRVALGDDMSTCGNKVGTVATGNSTHSIGAADRIWGEDANNAENQKTNAGNGPIPADAADIVYNLGTSAFDQFAWANSDIDALRAYAKSDGTYLQGTVSFNASNPMPNGIVFIDTVSGNDITGSTPSSDLANVTVSGNAGTGPGGLFSGWLFVNGSLRIDGGFIAHGLIYSQNDIVYHGIGTGGVYGAMISRNIQDVVSTSIDSDLDGNALINYDCAFATTGDGTIRNRWKTTRGTYRELPCDGTSCS